MCGIIAAISVDRPVDRRLLDAATDTLVHRGPDHGASWIADSQHVGLGYRRLSILDLPGGNQPLFSESGDICLVANSEFYNYRELQRGLADRGHALRSDVDAEVVLHLYEERGPDCLLALRGEFAFALWDAGRRCLFAARDRLGIRPLYFAMHEGTLFLASEVKALWALGVPARWDLKSVYRVCHFIGHLGGPHRTLFAGVHQVPPGHYLLAKDGACRVEPYWDLEFPTEEELDQSRAQDIERIERTREILEEAVRLRLQSDVPVAFYLSGGLDSSCVIGMAARHLREPPHALTILFGTEDQREFDVARRTVDCLGGTVQPIVVTQKILAERLCEVVRHAESVFFNNQGVGRFLMSEAARRAGYKVVLTGDGADELFSGYPTFVLDQLQYGTASTRPSAPLRASDLRGEDIEQHLDEVSAGPLAVIARQLGWIPGWLWSFHLAGEQLLDLLHPDFRASFDGWNVYEELLQDLQLPERMRGREPLAVSLYAWSKCMLPHYILSYQSDRVDMAHGIEGRVPMLDHELVEHVVGLPSELKVRGAVEKYALREAAR
ncbi:MAG TPA: asparagine synthase (glutamine-hydrolyzing), partial [Anaeromyxobacteraceae bacterium]|nr:asparagine synthase (glutamine-hydrolyzing) [Anaeromyxobacteraceae bacterium]